MIAEKGCIGHTTRIEGSKSDSGGFVIAFVQFPHGENITHLTIFVGFDRFKFFTVGHSNRLFETLGKPFQIAQIGTRRNFTA